MYSEQDLELSDDKLDDIIESIEEKKLKIFEPTQDEFMSANKIVMDYIKENKRKIYGGYSQNKTIMKKNPKDSFYKDNDLPDVDFYSPDPLNDVVNISNRLHKAGFKDVEGAEAQHNETYKVFSNQGPEVADITYVPRNVYNRIPFIEIDGINYVHPSFMYIDLYRIMTEPYFSSRIWKKTISRLHKLQKHYPFNKASKPLNSAYDVPKDKQEKVKKINSIILDEIANKDNFIVVGQYAYNHFLKTSKIMKDNQLKRKYKLISNPFLQIISTNYILDTVSTINLIKKKLGIDATKISTKEFYPLWQFTGYSTVIYYDGFPVLHITSHNDRCIPTIKIDYEKNKSIQIGSFDFTLLMNLISLLRVRINKIEDKVHYHNIMTSQLIEMRKYFFKKHNKNLFDETTFQSFISNCVGDTIDPFRKARLEGIEKRTKGKYKWRYHAKSPKAAPDYKFANTSGNEIRKTRNLKVEKNLNRDAETKASPESESTESP
jgi:hypothetical protein